MRIVVAPDKFKGTLAGKEAADAICSGVQATLRDAEVVSVPIADGGEGTLEALLSAGATEHTHVVTGPLGSPTSARFVMLHGTAVIESSQACGLQLVSPTPDAALDTQSTGVGELVRLALDAGADRIVVALGGVASTDGGTGAARALGARFLTADGEPIGPGGRNLADLHEVDLAGVDHRIRRIPVVAATDVSNPLTGPTGAAHVYGPQKGAGPREVAILDSGLQRLAHVLERHTEVRIAQLPSAGAAGGMAGGLAALCNASIASGAELVLDLLGVERLIKRADLVITGEGRLDGQSVFGKAPVAVARLARRHSVPVIAIAGRVDRPQVESELGDMFAGLWSLVESVGQQRAMRDTATSLAAVTATALAQLTEA